MEFIMRRPGDRGFGAWLVIGLVPSSLFGEGLGRGKGNFGVCKDVLDSSIFYVVIGRGDVV